MNLVRCLAAAALFIATAAANADGRIYASDYTPEIPDQRALIAFDGERQVMLIENNIALREGRPTTSLGWVVPVPAVPEIAVADAKDVRAMYRRLRQQTDAQTLPVTPFVFAVAILAILASFFFKSERPDFRSMRSASWFGLVGAVLAAVSLPAGGPSGPASGVEVLKAMQVGPLDAKVVRASTGAELVSWLKSNGFAYGERDVAVVEDYLRRKWVLVVAKLAPQPGTAFAGASASPPLVLSFAATEAIYPVALTAVGGKPLELVLYVRAPARVETRAPMKLVFAGEAGKEVGYLRISDASKSAAALFDALKGGGTMTKLAGTLSPEDMRKDIQLVRASAQGSYRQLTAGPTFTFWVGGAAIVGFVAFLLQLAARGRWLCNGLAWFAIAMCLSPFALLILFGSVGQQWWDARKAARPAA